MPQKKRGAARRRLPDAARLGELLGVLVAELDEVGGRRGTREAYLARLREAGIEAVADGVLEDALRMPESIAVGVLPGFADGDTSIQDGAAQAVADALVPPRGARGCRRCTAAMPWGVFVSDRAAKTCSGST